MSEGTIAGIGAVLIVCAVVVLGMVWIYSDSHESINVYALDNVCRHYTGNETAVYYEEFGHQDSFVCESGNMLYIIGGGK